MKSALVTNDDGIDSAGLAILARAAVRAGFAVTVAAPHREASGASASLSALAAGGELLLDERRLPDLDDVPTFAAQASPALIAFLGVQGAFGEVPDVVLSGVNHGPNAGQAVLHSGTVGAALTAASHGAPALAVSLATSSARHWETADVVTAAAVGWFRDHLRPGQVINVNVPDVPADSFRGFRAAHLAHFGAVQATIGERRTGRVAVTFAEPEEEAEPGTDVAVLRDGYASVTTLSAPCEAGQPDVSALEVAGTPA